MNIPEFNTMLLDELAAYGIQFLDDFSNLNLRLLNKRYYHFINKNNLIEIVSPILKDLENKIIESKKKKEEILQKITNFSKSMGYFKESKIYYSQSPNSFIITRNTVFTHLEFTQDFDKLIIRCRDKKKREKLKLKECENQIKKYQILVKNISTLYEKIKSIPENRSSKSKHLEEQKIVSKSSLKKEMHSKSNKFKSAP